MNFKLMPFVTFNDVDTDRDVRPEAHYTFEMKSIAMDTIIMTEKDKDDPENFDTYATDKTANTRELAESILKGPATLDGIKTIHFDDTCKVPRFKLGEICGKKGIKVIRDRDKADAVIYGHKFTDSLFEMESAGSFNYKAAFIAQAKGLRLREI
jgi:hypothetical protein